MMTGAMFMAECLRQEGVTKVFGQCGHTNYALIDACHKLGIEYVSFRHEQMAAHAADAYFRVTAQARRAQRAPFAGHDQRADRRRHRRGRLHADGGHLRQHPRRTTMRASRIRASGSTPTRHRETSTGRSANASGASTTRSFCRRDAACAQPRADRTAGRGVARHSDGRVLRATSSRPAADHPPARRRLRAPAAAPTASPRRRSCSLAAQRPAIFAGNGAIAVRGAPRNCEFSRNRSAPRWRRR